MPRGGYRESNPGGRPKSLIPTKVVRVPEPVADQIKSGYYDALEKLLDDWKARQQAAKSHTRDWTKMNQFLEELDNLQSRAES